MSPSDGSCSSAAVVLTWIIHIQHHWVFVAAGSVHDCLPLEEAHKYFVQGKWCGLHIVALWCTMLTFYRAIDSDNGIGNMLL